MAFPHRCLWVADSGSQRPWKASYGSIIQSGSNQAIWSTDIQFWMCTTGPLLSSHQESWDTPVLSTQKPNGKVLLSLQGFLQHAAWEERPVLGEHVCCCPGCLEPWPGCRAGHDSVHFFGLWPESLSVCFTNSYLESQIRLVKKPAPHGAINVT